MAVTVQCYQMKIADKYSLKQKLAVSNGMPRSRIKDERPTLTETFI